MNHPLEIYYGYLTDGLFTDQNDIDSWFNQTAVAPGSKPGDLRYRDISGPDGVPDGKVDATYDRVVLGSRIPKYSYGINLSLNYKNFDFGALVQGVGGAKGYLDNYAGFALYQNGNIQRWQYENRWTEENRDRNAEYPRMELIPNTGTSNTLVSDYWTQDASYVRLKNVQIGYTLPKDLLSRINVDNVRVYVNGENLHTWSSYRQGWDPEINSGAAYYPILRNFTFGLNFTF